MAKWLTRIGLLALWVCSLSCSAYATGPEVLGTETDETQSVRSVPVHGLENENTQTVLAPETAASNDFLQGGSPLSTSYDGPALTSGVKALSKQEIRVLVDQVLSQMAKAGLEDNLSKVLSYISNGDYAGLIAFQKENPDVMNAFVNALHNVSGPRFETPPAIVPPGELPSLGGAGPFAEFVPGVGANPGNNSGKDYIDRWLSEFRKIQGRLSSPGAEHSELLVNEVSKLYQPIATRISEVTKDVEAVSHSLKSSSGRKTSSDDLLKDFSEKAKKAIVDSLNQAQANLADGLLSNPVEATAFASETAPASGEIVGGRKMLPSEMFAKHKQYRVIDSVFLGKEFVYAQKMLHPPQNLHPYLKWLLYARNLTPRMMENYLKTREAAMTLYMRAKEGQGSIRYKGQIYGAFLPFAETAVGNFELVEPVSGQ